MGLPFLYNGPSLMRLFFAHFIHSYLRKSIVPELADYVGQTFVGVPRRLLSPVQARACQRIR